ncbi:FAD-dependent oxidoreductase [Bradyrhizobium sp. 169]|uniref:NAD(P)/FAD-dependent oxidoreductase n=1 Tax=Bradyrhizobium sp. 169 TaxID=2782640 RepID=UPI001FFB2EF8|nr:FAD-dependent oxidoreductase [Bradyrhizobium sp. 169]MCK1592104.1 FAD-dependent oxidoreductase [Bradyrhizobium sp. 169]
MGDFVIVGSGIAGHRAASELHRLAPDQTVYVVGAELGPPYDRPPLSKEYLLAAEPVCPDLRPSDIYGSNVRLRDGLRATSIDRQNRAVILSQGSQLHYDKLLLATGSRLRQLPLPHVDPGSIFYLRTLEDAQKLKKALFEGNRVAIIGGGFVGLEVAAAARLRGCTVTVLERAPLLLSRGATPTLAEFVRAMHIKRGVDILLDASVDEIFEEGRDIVLRWSGGELRSDIIVLGIGIIPNVELALECGLPTADGILVDEQCRTPDGAIFAAGEVTNYPIERLGLRVRTESWSSASAQAVVAAKIMVGQDSSMNELPWFWSDQYDSNIQCIGLPNRASHFLQIGDADSDSWLRIGVDEAGVLVGAEGVNRGRDISVLRRADQKGQPIPAAFFGHSAISHVADAQTFEEIRS